METRKCPLCGGATPTEVLGGLSPRCVRKQVMTLGESEPGSADAREVMEFSRQTPEAEGLGVEAPDTGGAVLVSPVIPSAVEQ